MADDKTLLDYKAASRLTTLGVGTLRWLVHLQRIPHVRLGDRTVRFESAEPSCDGSLPIECLNWIARVRGAGAARRARHDRDRRQVRFVRLNNATRTMQMDANE